MERFAIGDVEIASIVERDGAWRNPLAMYPGAGRELVDEHLRGLPDFVYDAARDLLIVTYQTFVLRTRRHTILIDTCVGEDKPGRGAWLDYPKQPWLDGFTALGLKFEDIDYVFCTHLHVDHCGWNTRLVDGRWVPTFPRARYIFSKREYDFWAAETGKGADPPGEVWRDSCLPVVEAGQALLVEDDFALDDSIWLTPTPGHSPGHVCVNLQSNGRRALFTGDLMHHALQCREPGWHSCFCWDAEMSNQSRRGILESVTDTDTLVVPCHFPGPTAGHVVSDGDRFDYRFMAT